MKKELVGNKIHAFFLMLFLCTIIWKINTTEAYAATIGRNVNVPTQQEIIKYFKGTSFMTNRQVSYAKGPSTNLPYSPGVLSSATENQALEALNFLRYVAGIPCNVKIGDGYRTKVQAGALITAVNGTLSHSPACPKGMENSLYELGYSGNGSSNIGLGYDNIVESILDGYMGDTSGSNLACVGHRRWCLNPKMGYTAFGYVSKGTAMYAFDRSNACDYYGVSWPAENQPIEFFNSNFPWSISFGVTVDISTTSVKLERKSDGKIWNFSNTYSDGYFNVNNEGYGITGCVIFRPNLENGYKYSDGDSYHVTVKANGKQVEYDVNFFKIMIPEKPVIVMQPSDAKVEIGRQASFSVVAKGETTALTYLWQYKYAGETAWRDWASKNTATISVAYEAIRNDMQLRCKITEGKSEPAFTDSVKLSYEIKGNSENPVIISQPNDMKVNDGKPAYFSVVAIGNNLSYLWQYKYAGDSLWNNWKTKTTASISVAYDSCRSGMSLRCRITDENGKSVYSREVLLMYSSSGPIITKNPAGACVMEGKPAYFDVAAIGSELKYLWQYKYAGESVWKNWNSKTTSSISVAYDSIRNGMGLRCEITDSNGRKALTDEVVLIYKSNGPVIIAQPRNTAVAKKKIAYFEVEAEGENLTYLWQYHYAGEKTWTNWNSKTTASMSVAYDIMRDGMSLRCVVTDKNGKKVISQEAVLNYVK